MRKLLTFVITAVLASLTIIGCPNPDPDDKDTVYLTDTVIKKDTVIVKDTINDTLIIEDTIIVKDTVIVKDTTGKYYEYITFQTFLPETLLLFNEYHLDYTTEYEENSLKFGFIYPQEHGWVPSNSNRNPFYDNPSFRSSIDLIGGKSINIYYAKGKNFPIVPINKDIKVLFYAFVERYRYEYAIVDSSLNLSKKVKAIVNPLEVKEVYKDKEVYKALLGVKNKYIGLWKDSYFVDGLYKPKQDDYYAVGRNFDGTLYGYATDSKGNKVRWDGTSHSNRSDTLYIETPAEYLESDFKLSEVFIEFTYKGGDKNVSTSFYVEGTTDTLKIQW
jgi:hypothetical protein